MKRFLFKTIPFALLFAFPLQLSAAVSVKMFSRDEALYQQNMSKPRIYLHNTGTETINGACYYYYFTTENGKQPVVENYNNPQPVTLENLGNGTFRLKYDLTGISINPGAVIPASDGNCTGLHYSDWSAWDKSNDISNNGSEQFFENQNIPVFTTNGIQIYGSDNNGGIPQPDDDINNTYISDIFNYTVYSLIETNIRDRAKIKGGAAGSNGYVEAGCDAIIGGNIVSCVNIFLRERARIEGDVIANTTITEQNNVVVTGEKIPNADVSNLTLDCPQPAIGTVDISVPDDATFDLQPGDYKDFHAYSRAKLTLHPGVYNFRKFLLEPDVQITINNIAGELVEVHVLENLRLADRTHIDFSTEMYPFSLKINTCQTSGLAIGCDSDLNAIITACNADITVFSRVKITGAVYGKKVIVEPEAEICKPALLSDILHSEWAYAAPFNPYRIKYHAIVPDVTSTLLVTPIAEDHTLDIKVNGNTPDIPVNLDQNPKDILIELFGGACNTKTTYAMKVTRSAACVIFVNDDSPANPGQEDGASWQSAYKDLQQALDAAKVLGKEIWVAEGTYKPTRRVVSNNSRTATFEIVSGTELIGGFKGTETERNPKGSVYKTILSGDITGDDNNLSSWPPAQSDFDYLDDNVFHVLTFTGFALTRSQKVEGFTITGGVADVRDENYSHGAGIFNARSSPTIMKCVIRKNYSILAGAGMFSKTGPKLLQNCLFESNFAAQGNGGGLYLSRNTQGSIDGCVFDNNKTGTNELFGGALYAVNSSISMINSVFTRNSSGAGGGAIYNKKGNLAITNCTFADNQSVNGAGGITNSSSSTAIIINTIVWGNTGIAQMQGDGISVTYSCIQGGWQGGNNISGDPQFEDAGNPKGSDGEYGTEDDGLIIKESGSCYDAGTDISAPQYDLRYMPRPTGEFIDIGAYEYCEIKGKFIYGEYTTTGFEERNDIPVINNARDIYDVNKAIQGKLSRVLQINVPKNKYTKSKNSIYGYVYFVDDDNKPISGTKTRIDLYRIGGTQLFRTKYYENDIHPVGKVVVAVTNTDLSNKVFDHVVIIHGRDEWRLKIEIPHKQFN